MPGMMERKAVKAVWAGDEVNPWMMAKLQGATIRRGRSTNSRRARCSRSCRRSTDFVMRITVLVEGELVVRRVRRSVQLEEPEQSLGSVGH